MGHYLTERAIGHAEAGRRLPAAKYDVIWKSVTSVNYLNVT